MFVDQLLELYRAGVLRRRVYDCLPLERLLAGGEIGERFDERILALLAAAGAGPQLERGGVRRAAASRRVSRGVEFAGGRVRAPGGEWIARRSRRPARPRALGGECLGRELRNGQLLHAGFFLGPRGFYAALRELPESERAQFGMRGVGFVNQLYGADQELRILQRRDARCVNTTMMVTLLGAAVSDALESGQVVSGVGGQYNFVAMAHALPGARSILCLRATRTAPRPHHFQHRLELRPRDDSAPPARYRHHRIRHRGPARPHRRGDHRGAAERRRFALPAGAAGARAGRRQDPRPLPHSGSVRNNLPQRLERALQPTVSAATSVSIPSAQISPPRRSCSRARSVGSSHAAAAAGRASRRRWRPLARGRRRAVHAAALQRMGLERPRSLAEWLQQRLVGLALEATAAPRAADAPAPPR